jgi:hypothetical protein
MKKQFLIIETTAEHCRGYNRATKGRETIRKVEADSAPEALQNWLSEMAEVYKVSWVQEKYKSGFVKDSDPELYVWQEGDHSADFGDFVVHVETIIEEGAISPAFDNLFGTLGEMLNPLTSKP